MSSPFEPSTKRGSAEESIQAIERATTWASRIDTRNDISGVDVDSFVSELREEKERLRQEYRMKTTEVAIENFVVNNQEKVVNILAGNLDEKVSALDDLETYIGDDFGYEDPFSFSKEELVWLVAQEVEYHAGSQYGADEYEEEPVASMSLDTEGEIPSQWEGQSFPVYNRTK